MLEGFHYVEYNNLKAWEEAIDENTAFLMIEPLQGEGGRNRRLSDVSRRGRARRDDRSARRGDA